MKKILAAVLTVVMLLCLTPMGFTAAADTDFTDYYGQWALSFLPNADTLLYVYDQLADGIEDSKRVIDLSARDVSLDEFQTAFDAYRRDYAQHFWLGTQYTYVVIDNCIKSMTPEYTMTGKALQTAKENMELAIQEILAGIDESMSEFEKEVYLHDALAARVTYIEAAQAHNAYGALVQGRAVCEGYAKALQCLLHRVGISSFLAFGTGYDPATNESEAHAWNYVQIDGHYYHVDLTWNDQDIYLFHSYFNLTDEMILQDHTLDETAYPLPFCVATEAHYFKMNGRWLTNPTVNDLIVLLKENDLQVSVYFTGDMEVFLYWYYANVSYIAYNVGLRGEFTYGYMLFGNEVCLFLQGNRTGWGKVDGRWVYYEKNTIVKNRWVRDSQGWCYVDGDGFLLTNAWKNDSSGRCYLDGDGRMVINDWIKHNGKWYYLDKDGYMVSNKWLKDSVGWVYVGSDGAMLTNKWVKDSVGWCYVGDNGYCVTNCWKKDSKGWCYLDKDGRMVTNKWVKDSVGWCYVDQNGYCVTNKWVKDSHGWCYMDKNGRMTVSDWVQDGDDWYYLDDEGYMLADTTVTIDGKTYTFAPSGAWLSE